MLLQLLDAQHLRSSRQRAETGNGVTCALAVCLALAAGCGTLATRREDPPFGAYPLQAVAYDFAYMARTFGAGEDVSGAVVSGPWFLIGGLLSLPFDLFNDLLVLPVDIGCWIAGYDKPWAKEQ